MPIIQLSNSCIKFECWCHSKKLRWNALCLTTAPVYRPKERNFPGILIYPDYRPVMDMTLMSWRLDCYLKHGVRRPCLKSLAAIETIRVAYLQNVGPIIPRFAHHVYSVAYSASAQPGLTRQAGVGLYPGQWAWVGLFCDMTSMLRRPIYSGGLADAAVYQIYTGGASGMAPVSYVPAQVVVREKNYMCPLDPSRPPSQRKVYVKIHEMCQNTAQSMLNFSSFPVVNGQSTCC